MPRMFTFMCTAARFFFAGCEYRKGQVVRMSATNPLLAKFKESGAFEMNFVDVADPPKKNSEEVDSEEEILDRLSGIASDVIELMKDKEWTPEFIVSEECTFEMLTDIEGVGKATANKIIEACEELIEQVANEEEN